MKMTKILSFVLVLVMLASCFSFVGCENKEEAIEIKLWVSTTEGVSDLFMEQVEAFKAANPSYEFTVTIETVSEGDAGTEVLKDVATAPDMYCFAQDQIARLVQGGALAPLGVNASATVTANNDAGSVGAATVGEKIYAYPMTSDNGYFLYYDSRYISDEQAKTWEGIVEACKAAGKKVAYNLGEAWRGSGFAFAQPVGGGAPLCTSTWTYSADGKNPIALNDTFNSDNGVIAMKALNALATSGVWVDSTAFTGTAAVVDGVWASANAQGEYGDYMKATKLPTFTVDGKTYQTGSFSGYKLIGCKPQSNEKKAEICNALALYLTSEDAQLERYYEFGWGPSNNAAQGNQDVQGDPLLAALLEQNVYSVPQGVIPNDWWTEAVALYTACAEVGKTEADFRAALATYEEKVNAMIVK
ncbi:MAG: extracellular solute-binding protein [Clostridiales bacterium]|nr:extracellular solute-binding protein [Clostridiales bacterium]